MSVSLVLGIIAVIIILYIIIAYNLLVRADNNVKRAWSEVEVQIKRRYDLIPNLVEVVKAYALHEKTTLENVIKARSGAMSVRGGADKHYSAENNLSAALKGVFALSEKYPTLKASENFLKLQFELTDAEDRIKASRRFYNTNVMDLNTKIEQFPCNIIAGIFNYKQAEYFKLSPEEAQAASKAVEVKL